MNWPAWKASKRQKRFRGSNPLLSAKRRNTISQTTSAERQKFFIGRATIEFIRMVALPIKRTPFGSRLSRVSFFCQGPRGERAGIGVKRSERSSRSSQSPGAHCKTLLRRRYPTSPPLSPPLAKGEGYFLAKNSLWESFESCFFFLPGPPWRAGGEPPTYKLPLYLRGGICSSPIKRLPRRSAPRNDA